MKRGSNQLRIIAGEWRGRRLSFPDSDGLRPTGDRVRETLFNWLQPYIPGARCLDLFAGSGALGLEALSRGAEEAVFVERARPAVQALEANLQKLQAKGAHVLQGDALRYLAGPARRFDVVFLDPPFGSDIIGDCCSRLEEGGWLSDGALIYLEHDAARPLPPLPAGWSLHRSGRAGQVAFHLARRTGNSSNQ